MIETAPFPPLAATVRHRVTGSVDQQEAERGASETLLLVQQLAAAEGPLNLVLDLRGMHFLTLQAHKAWSQGFSANRGECSHPSLPHQVAPKLAAPGDDVGTSYDWGGAPSISR